ncbi:MAG: hypothetical protein ABFS46_06335 [Myxococcota bacterium]
MASSAAGGELPLVYTPEEILSDPEVEEPLVAGGVRCHGGFDGAGRYRSPRTRFRAPAIRAWQDRLAHEGSPLVDVSRELIPSQYPNVAQSKLLLRAGVRDPIVRSLTIISIVEGFGAIIRDVEVPDLESLALEPIQGTALAHLRGALFEAHARDEAGHRDQGGHKQMWEAARDLALENPRVPGDVLMRLMGRRQGSRARTRAFPALDEKLERMLTTMATVLVIEVFAGNTFDWGQALLSDPEVSANPEEAGAMVGYIRADENPHVEYLRTALSEVRARTLRTVDGATLPGAQVVDALMHRTLHTLTTERPRQQRRDIRESLAEAMQGARDPGRLLEEFDALETVWTPPSRTGFEPATAGT